MTFQTNCTVSYRLYVRKRLFGTFFNEKKYLQNLGDQLQQLLNILVYRTVSTRKSTCPRNIDKRKYSEENEYGSYKCLSGLKSLLNNLRSDRTSINENQVQVYHKLGSYSPHRRTSSCLLKNMTSDKI